MKNDRKNIHVTFRLTEDEYAKFSQAISELGVTKSSFFRLLTLDKIDTYNPPKRTSADYKKCLHYLNKTSNNMNQIAHRLNADHLKGVVAPNHYKNVLKLLIDIKQHLNEVVK